MACKTRFDPRSGSYVKTCSKKRRKKGLFGDVSDLGAGLRGRAKGFLTFAGISMPSLVYAGGIGALGALGSKYIWNLLDPNKTIAKTPGVKAFAEMSTGVGLGIVVMKLLKQPRLGAALMVGPIVLGIFDLVKPMLPASIQASMGGIPNIRLVGPQSYQTASRLPIALKGVPQVGRRIPKWTNYPTSVAASV